MSLYKTAVSRPTATFMVFLGVLVLGIYSAIQLPVELFPEIDPPNISVITTYPGAGATEIEQNITEEIEDQLSTVSNLNEITSTSVDNLSIINMEFSWESDLDEITNEVRDVLGNVEPQLPDDAEEPVIFRFGASSFPVMILAATADESFPNIRQILEEEVISPLNRIEGVGNVSLRGGPTRQIQVLLNPSQIEAYNINIQQLAQTLRTENITAPAGDINVGDLEYNIRIDTEFETIDDIRNVVVSNQNNQTIFLKDIAEIQDALEEPDRIERINGERGVTIVVQKQSDANTIAVANNVKETIPELEENLPQDVNLRTVIDTSDFIINSVENLQQVLIYALIFVVLVVLFFLKRWRATLIVALAIPFSLIGAFIYLSLTGNSLNIISLSSLSIALGMVVDDAIVVFENVMKHIERGSRPKEAAIYGTNEVGIAVLATTLTVVAVFFPLTFLSGITGIWFSQLGYIVSVTIIISTLAALSLIPMLASVLLKQKKKEKKLGKVKQKRYEITEKILSGLDNVYIKSLQWALNRKRITVGIAIAIFVGSFFLVGSIGTTFMPERDAGQLSLTVELATGRSLESARNVIDNIENIFNEKVPELQIMTAGAGSTSGTSTFGSSSAASNIIDITARVVPVSERDRSVFEIADMLRDELDDIPKVIDYSIETQGGGGGQQESPIAINVIGDNLEEVMQVSEQIADSMRHIPGTRDVSLSRDEPRPELSIDFDREKLASFGLNAQSVAQTINSKIAGVTASEFSDEGEEYDIEIQYAPRFRESIDDIRNIRINTPTGGFVRLRQIGEVEQVYAPPRIEHIDRERAITVSSDIYQSSIGEIMEQIRPYIQQMDLPANVRVDYGGEFEEQQEAFSNLFLILGISLILVYIVMAGQFESFKDPFVIMFSIPFAFTGVILALFLTSTKLSVIAFIGGVILVGIVVKNAIVLVDYINLLRGRGEELYESIVNSGRSRLRPVLMTSLTTILAMVPLALSGGEGAETWRPMAIAVIGGLTFSTLVTLILVPVMYAIIERKSAGKNKKRSLVS